MKKKHKIPVSYETGLLFLIRTTFLYIYLPMRKKRLPHCCVKRCKCQSPDRTVCPAYAGKRHRGSFSRSTTRVHPRTCGEKSRCLRKKPDVFAVDVQVFLQCPLNFNMLFRPAGPTFCPILNKKKRPRQVSFFVPSASVDSCGAMSFFTAMQYR